MAIGVALRRSSRAGFSQGERIKLANGQCRGDFQRGGTAHACAHGNIAKDCRIESAEVDAALAELVEDTFDIIRPWRSGILLQFTAPKEFAFREGAGD